MIRAELRRLTTWEERHRRLIARLVLILIATLLLDAVASVAVYFLERHAKGTEITSFGDSAFFTTVQLLTVSSQIKNPLTAGGRIVDVILELWAVAVVAGATGSIATFFLSGDA